MTEALSSNLDQWSQCPCGINLSAQNRKHTEGSLQSDCVVCVPTYVELHMFIMQVLVSQLHFQANRNAELAIPPLFWPVNCIKIEGYFELLSGPAVHRVLSVT